jgi:hypothetical protein
MSRTLRLRGTAISAAVPGPGAVYDELTELAEALGLEVDTADPESPQNV